MSVTFKLIQAMQSCMQWVGSFNGLRPARREMKVSAGSGVASPGLCILKESNGREIHCFGIGKDTPKPVQGYINPSACLNSSHFSLNKK